MVDHVTMVDISLGIHRVVLEIKCITPEQTRKFLFFLLKAWDYHCMLHESSKVASQCNGFVGSQIPVPSGLDQTPLWMFFWEFELLHAW